MRRPAISTDDPDTAIAAPPRDGPTRPNATQLADRLRAELADGRYPPGQRLVEGEVSRETGASRAHVRDALRQLRAEGLVEIEEHRGAVVKRLTREEVLAVGRVRESLEGLAARLLAERGLDAEERRRLLALRAELVATAEAENVAGYAAANDALHGFIIGQCGNDYVDRFLAGLRLHVRRTLLFTPFRHDAMLGGNIEHLALIDAILLGHGEIAEAMMRMHVRKGTDMIDRAMGDGNNKAARGAGRRKR